VLAECGCRFHNRGDVSKTKNVDRALLFESRTPAKHERLLHPWIQMPKGDKNLLQSLDRPLSIELPSRISEPMPTCVEPQQCAQLTPMINGLPGELEMFGDLFDAPCAAFLGKKSLALAHSIQARLGEGIIICKRFEGFGLLEGSGYHRHITALTRRVLNSTSIGVLENSEQRPKRPFRRYLANRILE
jgi:hypothetical protein